MQKIILIYGLIAGAIVSSMLVITQPMLGNGMINYDNGMIVGYTSMVIALSVVFFGIKTFRDQEGKGKISFGTAFKIGILITLIASLMYAVSWEIYYNTVGSDFMEHYTSYQIKKQRERGATEEMIKATQKEMADFSELYKNPVIRFGMTLMEIFPVGILITLICAALLRKKEILPQSA